MHGYIKHAVSNNVVTVHSVSKGDRHACAWVNLLPGPYTGAVIFVRTFQFSQNWDQGNTAIIEMVRSGGGG